MTIRYTLIACLFASSLFAQNTEENLPRYLTAQEKLQMQTGPLLASPPLAGVITTPPTLPVRTMAEWEELQALVITWRGQAAILTEIVSAAKEECKVIICCNDQSTVTSAKNTLTAANVDFTSNVDFVVIPNNSIWVRDYGPNCVYANDVDSLYIVDWIYNRPSRPLDNTLPVGLAQYLGLPIYATSTAPYAMVNTGGNFMSDGMGTAFASKLILQENVAGNPYGIPAQSESAINDIFQNFMGIDRYIKMETLPYDAIHHIDMHMKLIDEETLLVGEYPEGTADGPQIEANIQYVLSNYNSAFGTPYKLVRVPMPPDYNNDYPDSDGDYRTYANAVFVNKTVILPFYEEQFDTTARRIWEEALPGYKIVGIDCNSIIPSLGAIHCITKEIGVADPLRVIHQELTCKDNSLNPSYPVYATLQHRSGISGATVYYSTDPAASVWQSVVMQDLSADSANLWHADIPQQADGSTVYYYIQATANNGKTVVHPLTAPEGAWRFCVTQSVATKEPDNAVLLDIFPNPAGAITCIPVKATEKTRGSIRIYNTLGQLKATVFDGDFPAGSSNHFIDAAQYAPGAYFVELQTPGKTSLKKLIVK